MSLLGPPGIGIDQGQFLADVHFIDDVRALYHDGKVFLQERLGRRILAQHPAYAGHPSPIAARRIVFPGLACLVEGLGQDLIGKLPFTLIKGNHTFKLQPNPLRLADERFLYR
jgi:hypothetical protein